MRYLSVKNFEKYQHYKDRRPAWIKLYNELLDDYAFCCLQDASKAHLICIWLLASRHENRIPYDIHWIAKAIQATGPIDVDALVSAGFLVASEPEQNASDALAAASVPAMPEREREKEKETETTPARARRVLVPTADERVVLDHYLAKHPRRRVGDKDVRAVRNALSWGYPPPDLCEAIDGNKADPWHAERNKHELPYVLRDTGKIDTFRERRRALLPSVAVDEHGVLTPEAELATRPRAA